jgi:hypothetical protein
MFSNRSEHKAASIRLLRAAADETLHRGDGARGMQSPLPQGHGSDGDFSVLGDANGAGRAAAAVLIGQQDGKAAIDDADEGVRRAEVDAEDGGAEFKVSGFKFEGCLNTGRHSKSNHGIAHHQLLSKTNLTDAQIAEAAAHLVDPAVSSAACEG